MRRLFAVVIVPVRTNAGCKSNTTLKEIFPASYNLPADSSVGEKERGRGGVDFPPLCQVILANLSGSLLSLPASFASMSLPRLTRLFFLSLYFFVFFSHASREAATPPALLSEVKH